MSRDFQRARTKPTYVATRRLFLRLLGVVYLAAFWSLEGQLDGLFGPSGLAPVATSLERIGGSLGGPAFLEIPTVFWWLEATDAALRGVALAGMAAAAVLIVGWLPLPVLLVLWLLYLSLVAVGEPFLNFQWDALLLETGFLAVLWAPATASLGSARARDPSPIVLFLLRLLLFRLTFFSGWVKLASGDSTWWDLTALEYHYWTQPLPTWTSWWADLLPGWFQRLSCAVMFAIELVLPFFVFGPRRARLFAAAAFVFFQVAIAATGNYGFFNLLTAVLCVPLLDDETWARRSRPAEALASPPGLPRRVLEAVVAAVLLTLAVPLSWRQLTGTMSPVDAALAPYTARLRPFHLVNAYGLFAVMTRTRPEVEIEGSADGSTWRPYVFRWKPGPLDRRPAFVAPHMPRLDWQMWFEGLALEGLLLRGEGARGGVTAALMRRLAEGSPSVLALLLENPFEAEPPRFLRWRLHHYEFTDAEEREQTGHWWKRELVRRTASGAAAAPPAAPRSPPPTDGPRR